MQDIKYKGNLIERIGGRSQFNFVVIDYCEKIQENPQLRYFFGHFELQDLIKLQKHFLDTVLLDLAPVEAGSAKGELMLKYYRLWHMGMNEHYFEMLKEHFLEALRESWAEETLVQQFLKYFEELRPLFQRSGKESLEENNSNKIQIVFGKNRTRNRQTRKYQKPDHTK